MVYRERQREKENFFSAAGRKKNMVGRRLVLTPFLLLLVFLKNRHEAQTHTRSSHVAELRCAHTHKHREKRQ